MAVQESDDEKQSMRAMRTSIKDPNSKDNKMNADTKRRLSSITSGATDRSMREHWRGDKFLIYPAVPSGSEVPKHVRDVAMLPRSKEKAEEVLKRHGTAVINVKGKKSSRDSSVGQDVYSCSYLGSGWWLDLVADGHGTAGEHVAERICHALPHYLNSAESSSLIDDDGIEEAYELAFERCQTDIVETLLPVLGIKLQFSGSTCICLLRKQGSKMLHLAWVGDSKAILISADGTVLNRTLEHKPDNAAEAERVIRMGCEVKDVKHGDNVLKKVFVEGQEYPAISFTRSFGDQCVKDMGVDAMPEVASWNTASTRGVGDGYVLLASDGIWEFMSEEEVGLFIADGLKRGHSSEEVLADLVKEAQQRWRTHEDDYCDDITVVLVPMKAPSCPQPPVPSECCECFAGCSLQ